jgi:hypothetical protein
MIPALPANDVVLIAIPGSRHVSRVRRCSCSTCRHSSVRSGRDARACSTPSIWLHGLIPCSHCQGGHQNLRPIDSVTEECVLDDGAHL